MLVIGGNSRLGKYIKTACNKNSLFVEETSRSVANSDAIMLDLLNAEDFDPVACVSEHAIFCSAATNMKWCENNPKQSNLINVVGTKTILNKLSDHGISGVFLSSSQVFDGEKNECDENSIAISKNLYGKQKLEIERYIIKQNLPFAILRISKIMSPGDLGIFDQWLKSLKNGQHINTATNMYLSPVTATDAALIAIKLANSQSRGVWHLSAPDQLSYAEAALYIAKISNLNLDLIYQSTVCETNVSSKFRSRYTVLNCKKLENEFGYLAPTSRSVIKNTLFEKH